MNYSSHISAINELAATEGIFTAGQAKRFGIPNDALSYAYRAGRLERIAKGAYRLTGSQPTRFDELSAVWKLTAPDKMSHERIFLSSWDGIAIGGTTAASLLGIGDFYLSPYRIFAPKRINSRNTSVRFGIRNIARVDVAFVEGLPVTKIERTLLDLCIDKEDPSLVADTLSDAMNKYAGSIDYRHLESLFANTMEPDKGKVCLDSLFADARIERKN
jgi:predicted transcriptional regulator of viral defense system